MDLNSYLGDNSYTAITKKIFESVRDCKPTTMRGQEMVSKLYESLGSSVSPMHEIKEFQTNAEAVSKEDVTLGEMLKFITKEQTGGDFNYLINLCKEEHYAKMKRNGISAPEKTLSDIAHLFDEPSNVVIEAIKNSLFDGKLDSNIYEELKNEYSIAPNTGFSKSANKVRKLNESVLLNNNGLIKYNPIAIKFITPEKNYYITPDTLLSRDDIGGWQKENLDLPPAYKALSIALRELPYSYDANEFRLSPEWDFDMCIDNGGLCQISKDGGDKTVVEKSDLQELFTSSIGFANVDANKQALIAEADRFILLANNYNKLMRIDEIAVLRNENDFALLNENMDFPMVIDSKNGPKKYQSFQGMMSNLNESFADNLDTLDVFRDRLLFENNLITEKNIELGRLDENNKNLQTLFEATNKVLKRAEVGSLVHNKANSEIKAINESIDANILKHKELETKPLY